jgi:hypothetical protein
VPKLHKIAKLKYDVKKSGVQNGGYKIDTDTINPKQMVGST